MYRICYAIFVMHLTFHLLEFCQISLVITPENISISRYHFIKRWKEELSEKITFNPNIHSLLRSLLLPVLCLCTVDHFKSFKIAYCSILDELMWTLFPVNDQHIKRLDITEDWSRPREIWISLVSQWFSVKKWRHDFNVEISQNKQKYLSPELQHPGQKL